MLEYSEYNDFLFVIDYVFQHDSALLDESQNINKKIVRLKDMFLSWKIIHEHKKFNLILINIYILIKTFKLVIKYRSIKYFKLLKIYTHV